MPQRKLLHLLTIMTMAVALILAATTGVASAASRGAPGSSTPGNPPTKTTSKTTTNKKSAAGVKAAISGAGYNNEGISNDGATTTANFDGSGNDYSNNALAAAGFASASVPDVNGLAYQWPTVTAGTSDNWVANGQVIDITTTGPALWFLGSATNGPSSGTATITYTDASTQTFTLAFSDWTLNAGNSTPITGNTIAATTTYRNTTAGGKETVNTDVFATSVSLTAGKTVASVTLPATVNQGHIHVLAITAQSDWNAYMYNTGKSGNNTAEVTLTKANFPNLAQKWTATGTNGISTQPVEANNTVYWGSWDGLLHATNVSGANVGKDQWQTNLGYNNVSGCDPQIAGIANTPIIGTAGSTPAIFVGDGGNENNADGNANYYAVNSATGAVIWKAKLGPAGTSGYFAWSSATLYNGSIYVGLASYGDCPLVQGGLLKLDAATGAVQSSFYTVPSGCTGDSIWGSPTIDTATGTVYVVTGNPGSCGTADVYGESMIALNSANLAVISHWSVPASQRNGDSDFGTTPVLFSGGGKSLVGAVNKNGIFYAFDRTNIGAGTYWQEQVATGGDCPQCGDADITPDVTDGTNLYIGTGNVTLNGTACKGSVSSVNPATGAYNWRHCLMSGPVLGALALVNGVVIATQGSYIMGIDTSTGTTIYRFQDPNPNSYYYAGASVANGRVFAGNLDGLFVALGL